MKNGDYELVLAPSNYPGMRYRGKYCYEHHALWWKTYKKIPPKGYIIHHKDGNKRNNVIENLEMKTSSEHNAHHASERPTPMIESVCPGCGIIFRRERRQAAMKPGKMRLLVCSLSCRGKAFGRGRPTSMYGEQEIKECRKFPDGRIEYPPYSDPVKSEFYRPKITDIKRERKVKEEIKIEKAIKIGKPIYFCPVCGKPRKKSLKFCSLKCVGKNNEKTDWSNLENLAKESSNNWFAIARILKVSEMAVRKRAKKIGIYEKKRKPYNYTGQ